MGNSSIAAVVAVFLAVVMTALCFAAESSIDSPQPDRPPELVEFEHVSAAHSLRGQAWAMELFGRRYGRNLLA